MSNIHQVQTSIEHKMNSHLMPSHMEVINESHMHNVPPNSETHFKVVVVSDAFEGKRAVARHQMIYKVLAEELEGPVHALALHTFTDSEWSQSGKAAPVSPQCLGGSKAEQH